MAKPLRNMIDRIFSIVTGLTVAFLVLVLVVVLAPMFAKGATAVFFRGTVEFRKMQLAQFGHGNETQVNEESEQTQKTRLRVYEIIDTFKRGVDIDTLTDQAKKVHRDFGDELQLKGIERDEYAELRSLSRSIRNDLTDAFQATEKNQIKENIDKILQYENDQHLTNTEAARYFTMARDFWESIQDVDLQKRQEYAQQLAEVEQIIRDLFGPRPGEPSPALAQFRYGATRWDQVQDLLHKLFWKQIWVQQESGKALVQKQISRPEQFKGTVLAQLFPYVEQNIDKMFNPRFTVYWRYFFDDSTPGHYFGGIGPEIYGTLLLTLLSMIFVVPLGVVSAAYLTECAKDSPVIRIIRMSINTLAGVPSIVFGLFGLAFFVLFLIPLFGGPSKPCVLAGSLTLAVLTLPVMIRASEEAIRTVPQSYKEGSLALGASRFRTFVTVILPAALPGILTGVILSLSRVAGETAPILFTAGVALGPPPTSVFQTTRTLSYGSWDMAVADKLAAMVPHKQYGMVVTLILLVLCLNALAIIVRWRVFKKLTGQ